MRCTDKTRASLHGYARKGSKAARRKQIARIEALADWCRKPLEQIGNKDLHEYWRVHSALSDDTKRDHFYAFKVLWEILGRDGVPPHWPPRAQGTVTTTNVCPTSPVRNEVAAPTPVDTSAPQGTP